MDRLIRRSGLCQENCQQAEDPFFAEAKVRQAFLGPMLYLDIRAFLECCGITSRSSLTQRELDLALEEISSGNWWLLTSNPFRPLGVDGYMRLTHCAPAFTGAPAMAEPEKGPGKWRTIDIDYEGVKNSLFILANRLGSLGDEGRVFGSEGKDYANSSRVVTLQWVSLDSHDDHLASRSAIRPYGELRTVTQRYFEGEDKWQISGKSWHWQPVQPHESYESRETKK